MVHIFDNAATEVQRGDLAGWATELRRANLLLPNPLGAGRFHRNIAELPRIHPTLIELRGGLVERFGLGRYRTDPAFGDMVSFHEPGGAVHPHTDPFVEGERHVRMNIIVQFPRAGGQPVLDGRRLDIQPGQGWIFRPYKVPHASTEVTGEIPRINLSFGWSVPPAFRLPGEATRSNIVIVEELFAAIRGWDEVGLRALVAPDVVVRIPGTSPFAGDHQGVDAVIALWARQRAFVPGRRLALETLDFLDGRDHVVVLTRARTDAGEWEAANVYRVRDGRIVEASPLVRGMAAFDAFWAGELGSVSGG